MVIHFSIVHVTSIWRRSRYTRAGHWVLILKAFIHVHHHSEEFRSGDQSQKAAKIGIFTLLKSNFYFRLAPQTVWIDVYQSPTTFLNHISEQHAKLSENWWIIYCRRNHSTTICPQPQTDVQNWKDSLSNALLLLSFIMPNGSTDKNTIIYTKCKNTCAKQNTTEHWIDNWDNRISFSVCHSVMKLTVYTRTAVAFMYFTNNQGKCSRKSCFSLTIFGQEDEIFRRRSNQPTVDWFADWSQMSAAS